MLHHPTPSPDIRLMLYGESFRRRCDLLIARSSHKAGVNVIHNCTDLHKAKQRGGRLRRHDARSSRACRDVVSRHCRRTFLYSCYVPLGGIRV
jgi:hypothetical protein